jgi:hypothetical protein
MDFMTTSGWSPEVHAARPLDRLDRVACTCANWEGTTPHHTAVFPEERFETLEREDLGDYWGATPHRGRLECVTCHATFSYETSLTSTVVTREREGPAEAEPSPR